MKLRKWTPKLFRDAKRGGPKPAVNPVPDSTDESGASKGLAKPSEQLSGTIHPPELDPPTAKHRTVRKLSAAVQTTATSVGDRGKPQTGTFYAAAGKRRTHYDEAFKRSAVEQWLHSGKTARVVAAELGIHVWNLRDWKKGYGPPESSILAERIAELEGENRDLRRELLMAQQQLDILKNLGHPLPGQRRRF